MPMSTQFKRLRLGDRHKSLGKLKVATLLTICLVIGMASFASAEEESILRQA